MWGYAFDANGKKRVGIRMGGEKYRLEHCTYRDGMASCYGGCVRYDPFACRRTGYGTGKTTSIHESEAVWQGTIEEPFIGV